MKSFFRSPAVLIPNLLTLLLAFLLAFREIRDMDIGFHLKAGHWMLENLKFPAGEVFAYAAYGREYIDLYWFYQICLALAETLGGPFAIVTWHAGLISLSVWLIMRRRDGLGKGTPGVLYGLVLFTGLHAASYHFGIRPHVFSWVYLNLMLFILERYARDRSSPLWPLPLILLFWANSHTLFVLGGVTFVCFFIGLSWEERRVDRRLLFWGTLSAATCFLNPYHVKGILLPFKQFLFLQSGNPFKGAIDEYKSPFATGIFPPYEINRDTVLFQPIFFFHAFIALAGLALLIRLVRRRLRAHEALLFAAFFYVMMSGFKNVGFFVMAVLPYAAAFLDFPPSERAPRGRASALSHAGMAVFFAVACLRLATNAYYAAWHSRDRFGYAYSDNNIAMRAMRFLNDNGLDGLVLNHINYGGMLMYFTNRPVYLDARNELIGEDLIRDYLLLNDAKGKDSALAKYKPDIVIFPSRRFTHWHDYFYRNPGWRLVFVDDSAEMYLRKGYREDLPRITLATPLASYPSRDATAIDALAARRLDPPQKWRMFLEGLYRRQYYPNAELDLASWHQRRGLYDGAVLASAEALAKATRDMPEPYYYLGISWYKKGDLLRARNAFARYLEKADNPSFAAWVRKVDEALAQKAPGAVK